MPNLKQSLTKQRISTLFLQAQHKLMAIRQSSLLADNKKSEFNALIEELIFLAEQGDKKQQLPAYRQWFQQHQAIIGQWLADPEVSDENKLRLRIKLATDCQTLIQAIRLYPGEITSVGHNMILQKAGLVQAINDLWHSEKKREIITNPAFNWEGSLITRQFGIRAQIIDMAQAELCSSDEAQFVEKICAATTYTELAQIIRAYQGTIYSSQGEVIDGENLAMMVVTLLSDRDQVKRLVEHEAVSPTQKNADPAPLWRYVPRRYHLRAQVIKIATTLYQLLFSAQAQQFTQAIAQSASMAELITVVRNHEGILLNSKNCPLDNQALINYLGECLIHPLAINYITQNYGLRETVAQLCTRGPVLMHSTVNDRFPCKSLDNIEVDFSPPLTFAFPAMNKNSCEQAKPVYPSHHEREKTIFFKRTTL